MNLYEVLGISVNASQDEVKGAYFVMLRRYPAESHPDQFQQIQRAYQVLKDPSKRKTYDVEEMYGNEIERLTEQAMNYFEQEQYEQANRTYEKLLKYLPEDTGYLNRYAMSYSRMGQQDLAIQYYKKAIALESDSAVYHYNIAVSYEKKGEYNRAVRSFKQAMICEPFNYDIVEALSHLYLDIDECENAWFVVEAALKKPGMPQELKPVYIKRLLEIAVIQKGKFEMKIALKHAEKLLLNTPVMKDDVIVTLYNFALKLSKLNNYEWALPIIDFVKLHDPYDNQVHNLHHTIHEDAKIYLEFDRLVEDESVLQVMRHKIYLYLYSNEYEEDEFEERVITINEAVIDACYDTPSQVRASIRHLKLYYPNIANEMDSWIERLHSVV